MHQIFTLRSLLTVGDTDDSAGSNIRSLLHDGQDVLVQVLKDPFRQQRAALNHTRY